jgi:hypothetical protein
MTLGLSMTKRGSLVSSVAAPETTTSPMLSHCIVSIGLRRARDQAIWATPIATPIATASLTSLPISSTARKTIVEARSEASSLADRIRCSTGP